MLNLLLAVLLLEIGSGLQSVLIPIRGELAGFSTPLLGALGTMYYIGFVAGCLLLAATVRRVGHIRCFAALAALAASAALLHALVVLPWAWLVLRLGLGFCFAGLFMVIESWLNSQTQPETRGRSLSLYMVATWMGVISGKLVFSLAPPETFELFSIAAIVIGLSLVPITLTRGEAPSIPQPERTSLFELYRIAPVGLLGCIAVGLANGAFWSFAPLFAQARSPSSWEVSLFLSACVAGGMLMQWPLGRFSDWVDRRWVIGASCLAAALAGLVMPFVHFASGAVYLTLAGVFGAAALSIYALCVAHANDRADPTTYVEVSSHLLLAFGLGAIAGPVLASLLITALGIDSLFIFTASIHISLALFVVVRIRQVEPPAAAERIVFASQPPLGHSTQTLVELQPGIDAVPEPIVESGSRPKESIGCQTMGKPSCTPPDEA